VAEFVLVHGAWHGGWCWSPVVDALSEAGHRATAPDLPGHGDDPTPVESVTLEDYTARIRAVCEEHAAPVVLVGHSMGGAVITRVAELVPDRVAALVYLAAFLPAPGQSILALASRDRESLISASLEPVGDGSTTRIPEDRAVAVFYADCDPRAAAEAARRLGPTPMQPLAAPVAYTEERFGRVPRIFIHCTRDAAISPGIQQEIHDTTAFERVVRLDASHSPFLSMPRMLAETLVSVLK
jgi:pimeloyl-ACP methyl ester carboxylesterase